MWSCISSLITHISCQKLRLSLTNIVDSYQEWNDLGIRYIYDLINQDGTIMQYNEFCTKYNFNPPITRYLGLRNSILERWSQLRNNINPPLFPAIPKYVYLLIRSKKGAKDIYNIFIEGLYQKPKSEIKWENTLNINLDFERWEKIYKSSIYFTIDVKLQWFQFRITHRILSTNTLLYKLGIRESNMCTFCEEEPETLIHFFCECRISRNFWSELENWIGQNTDYQLQLTEQMIIFGKTEGNKFALNLILCIAKYNLYRQRIKKLLPSIFALKWKLNITTT